MLRYVYHYSIYLCTHLLVRVHMYAFVLYACTLICFYNHKNVKKRLYTYVSLHINMELYHLYQEYVCTTKRI